jgi:hypothetical protein
MIHAYFDDSSDSKRADLVACGGVFGDSFNMSVVENLWTQVTKTLKEPFRSTDCECGHGQFQEWDRKDCIDLMTKLVDILSDEKLQVQGVGSVVPVPLYQKVFPNSDPGDPYRLALRHLFMQMAHIARKKGQRVKTWFEKGSSDGDILRAYTDVSQCRFTDPLLRDRLTGLEFGDKMLPLLQAADLGAREAYKVSQNMGVRRLRKPLLRLWEQTGIVVWSLDSLQKLQSIGNPSSAETLKNLPADLFMMQVIATPWSEMRLPI